MSEPYRYDDEEVRAIFERATKVEATPLVPAVVRGETPAEGFSLAEIQAIGAEAGIDPGRIAEAASALTRFGKQAPRRAPWGVPITVGHTTELPRTLTDLEWDHLVVRLRDTLGGPGTVTTEGSLRSWTHGHHQVLLEPTPTGARLRMTTTDWAAKQWVEGGVAGVGGGVIFATLFTALAVFGDPTAFIMPAAVLGGGFGVLGAASWLVGSRIAGRRLPRLKAQLATLGASALREVENDAERIPPPSP